jgi:hypothetical protein
VIQIRGDTEAAPGALNAGPSQFRVPPAAPLQASARWERPKVPLEARPRTGGYEGQDARPDWPAAPDLGLAQSAAGSA